LLLLLAGRLGKLLLLLVLLLHRLLLLLAVQVRQADWLWRRAARIGLLLLLDERAEVVVLAVHCGRLLLDADEVVHELLLLLVASRLLLLLLHRGRLVAVQLMRLLLHALRARRLVAAGRETQLLVQLVQLDESGARLLLLLLHGLLRGAGGERAARAELGRDRDGRDQGRRVDQGGGRGRCRCSLVLLLVQMVVLLLRIQSRRMVGGRRVIVVRLVVVVAVRVSRRVVKHCPCPLSSLLLLATLPVQSRSCSSRSASFHSQALNSLLARLAQLIPIGRGARPKSAPRR